MKNELISVIVPVYNIEKYLPQCIQSVLDQTYDCLELILIDDGATDKSGNICDEFAALDKRIKVVHQVNKGRSGARNAGLKIASGEFIMFVDGDDWVDLNCLQEAYAAIDENTEMVVFRGRNIYADKIEDESTGERKYFKGQEPLAFYVEGYKNFQILNAVWGKLYRRSLLKEIRFIEGKYYEDVMFTTKVYAKCKACVYLDRAYYNYNIATENSITYQGVNELTFRDEIPTFFEKESYLKEVGGEDLADRYAYFIYQRLILYFTVSVKKKEKSYSKRLAELIKKDKDKIKKILKNNYVSTYYKVYLSIFFISTKMAYAFGKLFQALVKNKFRNY